MSKTGVTHFIALLGLLGAALFILPGCGGETSKTAPQNLIVRIDSPEPGELFSQSDPPLIYTVTEGEDNHLVPVSRLSAFVDDVVDGELVTKEVTLLSEQRDVSLPSVSDGAHTLEFRVNDSQGGLQVTVIVIYTTAAGRPVADAGDDQSVHPETLEPSERLVVTLDGSESFDPNNLDFTFFWAFTARPPGSNAELSVDPELPDLPDFEVDVIGDYDIELVVTNSLGIDSAPDTVTVSAINTAPFADAGDDRFLTVIGSTVQLDGSLSHDADGDDFTFFWELTRRPDGSGAVLSGSSTANPTFEADVYGTYELTLEVTDSLGAVSDPNSPEATVTVTFENIKPVADVVGSQAVEVGEEVVLDGSGSEDANGDPLTYSWSMVRQPNGSGAKLDSIDTVKTSFTPDLPGMYKVKLVVRDGLLDSDPVTVTIMAVSIVGDIEFFLIKAIGIIGGLQPSDFIHPNRKKSLINKLNAVLFNVDKGDFQQARDKLVSDILPKIDGCAESEPPTPDGNDWIIDCPAQVQVRLLLQEAVSLLSLLAQRLSSPPVAALIAEQDVLQTATRLALTPLVYSAKYPRTATVV